MKAMDNTPFLNECREAYRKSQAFKAISEGRPLRHTVAAALPKKEMALGIEEDALEREFADRMEP